MNVVPAVFTHPDECCPCSVDPRSADNGLGVDTAVARPAWGRAWGQGSTEASFTQDTSRCSLLAERFLNTTRASLWSCVRSWGGAPRPQFTQGASRVASLLQHQRVGSGTGTAQWHSGIPCVASLWSPARGRGTPSSDADMIYDSLHSCSLYVHQALGSSDDA